MAREREVQTPDGVRFTPSQTWAALMGDQTPADFMARTPAGRGAWLSAQEAIRAYLADEPGRTDAAATGLDLEDVEELLQAYVLQELLWCEGCRRAAAMGGA